MNCPGLFLERQQSRGQMMIMARQALWLPSTPSQVVVWMNSCKRYILGTKGHGDWKTSIPRLARNAYPTGRKWNHIASWLATRSNTFDSFRTVSNLNCLSLTDPSG